MSIFVAILAVIILALIPLVGVGALGLDYLFGVIIPYAAIVIFLVGIVSRIFGWAKSPVPFKIPTVCGQQKSHDWIKSSTLESPHNTFGVIGRMFMEVVFFRSLFRNTEAELKEEGKLVYGSSKWLWMASLAFHYSFLVIFIRHFKFFAEPVPGFVHLAQTLDGFWQIGLPIVYMTNIIIVAAIGFLFIRRVWEPRLRYISLLGDYFPLALIGALVTSGICLRYFDKTDIVAIKELGMGLISLNPVVPDGIAITFYIHLFFVSCLFMFFPFSKLVHMVGVFFSPTRNMANNNRMVRHVNPWPSHDVKIHTYDEYEDEFRDLMKAAGLPVEKDEEAKS